MEDEIQHSGAENKSNQGVKSKLSNKHKGGGKGKLKSSHKTTKGVKCAELCSVGPTEELPQEAH